jgi:uncharacterized protein
MLLQVGSSRSDGELPPGYLARVGLNQPAEIFAVLQRADRYFQETGLLQPAPPIVMVLHGSEISIFDRHNYARYNEVVDLAAKLTAMQVIDVRICETQMAAEGMDRMDLLPFVETLPSGPDEVERLLEEEDFIYF